MIYFRILVPPESLPSIVGPRCAIRLARETTAALLADGQDRGPSWIFSDLSLQGVHPAAAPFSARCYPHDPESSGGFPVPPLRDRVISRYVDPDSGRGLCSGHV